MLADGGAGTAQPLSFMSRERKRVGTRRSHHSGGESDLEGGKKKMQVRFCLMTIEEGGDVSFQAKLIRCNRLLLRSVERIVETDAKVWHNFEKCSS